MSSARNAPSPTLASFGISSTVDASASLPISAPSSRSQTGVNHPAYSGYSQWRASSSSRTVPHVASPPKAADRYVALDDEQPEQPCQPEHEDGRHPEPDQGRHGQPQQHATEETHEPARTRRERHTITPSPAAIPAIGTAAITVDTIANPTTQAGCGSGGSAHGPRAPRET